MRTYENKDELKNEINKSFAKYISEFNDIAEHLKDKRIDEIDRTPAENLAYQVGWTTLVIKWESDERKGIPVKTPSDNFKWNQLGELYQWFTDTYAQLSLQELKDRLNENINSIYAMIDYLSDEELFKPHMRKWADEATNRNYAPTPGTLAIGAPPPPQGPPPAGQPQNTTYRTTNIQIKRSNVNDPEGTTL